MSPETSTDQPPGDRPERHPTGPPETRPPDSGSAPGTTGPAATPARRRINRTVLLMAALVALGAAAAWYLYQRGYESTDDAQVDGHLNPVAARIDGTIKAVYVDDNQPVESGKLLVELDPRDNQVAVDQARAQADQATAQARASHPNLPITRITNRTDLASQQAALADAQAALAAARHELDSTMAQLRQSQATDERSQADYRRYQILFEKNEVSRADYDQYRAGAAAQAESVRANQASVASARATVEQRQAQLEQQQSKLEQTRSSAPLQVAIRQADIRSQQANSEAAQAALEKARLNLDYCRIFAPVSGVVTQRSAEVGARISAGQQLLMIVQIDHLWVTANFKETQLAHMRTGQPVRIRVDALRDTFDGTIEGMPAVTGSRTSVLPPENATGNFVKVVQRLPVRISFNPGQRDLERLRPGMSVEPRVHLE